MRAFQPRFGKRGFASGGMTLEGADYTPPSQDYIDAITAASGGGEPQGTVTVEGAPAQASDQGGGGGGVDQGALNAIYEQYLGRGVDASGAATWAGQDPNAVIAGILGSQEYANRGGDQGGGGGVGSGLPGQITPNGALPGQDPNAPLTSDAAFVNKLYTDVLGRQADAGAQNWINALASGQMTTQDVAHQIASSQEAQQNTRSNTEEQRIADAIAAGYGGNAISPSDKATWQQGAMKPDSYYADPENRQYYYTDPKTGNVYNSNDENAQLVAKGSVFNDKNIAALGLDPIDAQNLYNLKSTDANAYYQQVANQLAQQTYDVSKMNGNADALNSQLQSLKTENPAAYYQAQLDLVSKQAGWQVGQNRGDRAQPMLDEIKTLAADAQRAGVKYDDIKTIVDKGFQTGNIENQQRIARDAETGGSGFNFQKDLQPGLVMLALAAAAAMTANPEILGLGEAGAAGGTAAGTGLTGGSGIGLTGGAAGGVGLTGAAGTTAASTLPSWLTAAGQGALTGGAMGGINSALSGGNLGQGILRGGLTGAVGGGLGNFAGGAFSSPALGQILGGAGAGAAGAALSGGNIGRGALYGGAGGALNAGMNTFAPAFAQNNPILSNAITGGALTSAMGGNFMKGAQAGAITGAISPYVSNAYNTYFGGGGQNYNTPTGAPSAGSIYVGQGGYNPYEGSAFTPSEINAGVGTPNTSGTPSGFAFTPQEINAGVGTPQTSGMSPADMRAAIDVNVPSAVDPQLAAIASEFGITPEQLKTSLSQGTVLGSYPDQSSDVLEAKLSPQNEKYTNDSLAALKSGKITGEEYDKRIGNVLAKEAANPNSDFVANQDGTYKQLSTNDTWFKDKDGVWTPSSGVQVPASTYSVNQDVMGGQTSSAPGLGSNLDTSKGVALAAFGTPSTDPNAGVALTGPGSSGDEGKPPLGFTALSLGSGNGTTPGAEPTELPDRIYIKNPETGKMEAYDTIELRDVITPDNKIKTADPVEKVDKVVEQKEQTAKDKEAAAEKAQKEVDKAGGGGQEGKTADAKAKLEEAKTKAEQAKQDAQAARAEANSAKSASQQGESGKIVSINKQTNVATIQFQNGETTQALVDPDAEIGLQAKVSSKEVFGKGTPATTAGAGTPTGQTAQLTTNKDGSTTYQNDDGSTYTRDANGNLVSTVDSDGQKYNIDENGQLVAVTGTEEGTPGTGGGTGGGAGTGTGEGEGSGSGAGAGGGGGGGGGAGTGTGKGTGTTGKPSGGSSIKYPVPTAGKGNPINLPGITNLTPGITAGDTSYELAGRAHFALGGSTSGSNSSSMGMGSSALDKYLAHLTPGLTEGATNYQLPGYFAKGGEVTEHNPEFFSEGGLGSLKNRYVKGKGDGTSDSIPAMLANGEFVIPADVVSSLGNGSNDSGAGLLDEFLKTIRKHKRAADAKNLPPDSKGALGYLLEAKKKVNK
jgi:YD repeat-containing protein